MTYGDAKVSDEDGWAIWRIAGRYIELRQKAVELGWEPEMKPREVAYTRISTAMDLEVVHAGTPLRLKDLLATDDFNFLHDVVGIRNHIDRELGVLHGGFLPRFHQPQEEEART